MGFSKRQARHQQVCLKKLLFDRRQTTSIHVIEKKEEEEKEGTQDSASLGTSINTISGFEPSCLHFRLWYRLQ